MRLLILLAGVLLATNVLAEKSSDIRVNRIDMAVTAPDTSDDADAKDEIESTEAQDYNSSRSNNINGEAPTPTEDPAPATRAQDYNSSRSNTTSSVDVDDKGGEDDSDEKSESVDKNQRK